MNQLPLKSRMELDNMNDLYSSLNDLRNFKEAVDDKLLDKMHRSCTGMIESYRNWPDYAAAIQTQLSEIQPSLGETIMFDISLLDRVAANSSSLVNIGQVTHLATSTEPYWQLSYIPKEW